MDQGMSQGFVKILVPAHHRQMNTALTHLTKVRDQMKVYLPDLMIMKGTDLDPNKDLASYKLQLLPFLKLTKNPKKHQ